MAMQSRSNGTCFARFFFCMVGPTVCLADNVRHFTNSVGGTILFGSACAFVLRRVSEGETMEIHGVAIIAEGFSNYSNRMIRDCNSSIHLSVNFHATLQSMKVKRFSHAF